MTLGCFPGVLEKCSTGAGNGVKRLEMMPEMEFSWLKSDFPSHVWAKSY